MDNFSMAGPLEMLVALSWCDLNVMCLRQMASIG